MQKPGAPRQDPAPEARGVERLDVETAAAAARHRHHPLVRTLGAASELADQIPLGTLCAAVIAGGLASRRPRLARIGTRMMAAHVLANLVKRQIKDRVRRTRPETLVKGDGYAFEARDGKGGPDTSFPSGHTAGAVAVAAIIARDAPRLALPAAGLAALIAAVQVPRARHYPLDILAGAAVGIGAARLADRLAPARTR